MRGEYQRKANPSTALDVIKGQKAHDLTRFFSYNDIFNNFLSLLNHYKEPSDWADQVVRIYSIFLSNEALAVEEMCMAWRLNRAKVEDLLIAHENGVDIMSTLLQEDFKVSSKFPFEKYCLPKIQNYFRSRITLRQIQRIAIGITKEKVITTRFRFHLWNIALDEYTKQMKSTPELDLIAGEGPIEYTLY